MKIQIIKHPQLVRRLHSVFSKNLAKQNRKFIHRIKKLREKPWFVSFVPIVILFVVNIFYTFLRIVFNIPVAIFTFIIDLTLHVYLAVINTPAWFIKTFLTPEGRMALREYAKKAAAKAEERRKARLKYKHEQLTLKQQEKERLLEVARKEKLRAQAEFRRILRETSTDDLLAIYAESKEDSTPTEVVNVIKAVLNERNVDATSIQTAITNYKLEKLYLQNLQMMAQQNATDIAELKFLQEQQNKRKLQLGLGIGIWF